MIVVTITDGVNITQRDGNNLTRALVDALLAHRDSIPGGVDGLFQLLAETMAQVWNYIDDDETCHDVNKLYYNTHNFLSDRKVPGYTKETQ